MSVNVRLVAAGVALLLVSSSLFLFTGVDVSVSAFVAAIASLGALTAAVRLGTRGRDAV